MRRNGFTLVELLAVIIILGVLATLITPNLMTLFREKQDILYENVIEEIKTTAISYAQDNLEIYNEVSDSKSTYIYINTLCNEKYIACPINNPKDNSNIKGAVKISYENEKFVYEYIENAPLVTLTIDKNGGNISCILSDEYEPGEVVDLTSCNPIKNDEEFNGWEVVLGDKAKINNNKLIIGYGNTTIKIIFNIEPTHGALTLTNKVGTGGLVNIGNGLRYVGTNVNNYVKFNCDNNGNNCETWRIVGGFDVENGSGKKEKRIKLVNLKSTFMASYDSSFVNLNSGNGINQYGPTIYNDESRTEYPGSDIYQFLNGYYIGEKSTCMYCNDVGHEICTKECDTPNETLSSKYMKPLTGNAQKLIDNAIWYTGVSELGTPSFVYNNERLSGGRTIVSDLKITSKDLAKVGLIYFSDYGYASGVSNNNSNVSEWKNDNWLYYGNKYITITPKSSSKSDVWTGGKAGGPTDGVNDNAFGIKPSVYLKSNVEISNNQGSQNDPYVLSIAS